MFLDHTGHKEDCNLGRLLKEIIMNHASRDEESKNQILGLLREERTEKWPPEVKQLVEECRHPSRIAGVFIAEP